MACELRPGAVGRSPLARGTSRCTAGSSACVVHRAMWQSWRVSGTVFQPPTPDRQPAVTEPVLKMTRPPGTGQLLWYTGYTANGRRLPEARSDMPCVIVSQWLAKGTDGSLFRAGLKQGAWWFYV